MSVRYQIYSRAMVSANIGQPFGVGLGIRRGYRSRGPFGRAFAFLGLAADSR